MTRFSTILLSIAAWFLMLALATCPPVAASEPVREYLAKECSDFLISHDDSHDTQEALVKQHAGRWVKWTGTILQIEETLWGTDVSVSCSSQLSTKHVIVSFGDALKSQTARISIGQKILYAAQIGGLSQLGDLLLRDGELTSSQASGEDTRRGREDTRFPGSPELGSGSSQPRAQPSATATAVPTEPRKELKSWTEPTTGMGFVWVPPGCYEMGCGSWTTSCNDNEKPVHTVCVDGFWMGKTEVTIAQWKRVIGNTHGNTWGTDNTPYAWTSWREAQDFISSLEQLSGNRYKFRLPREAEWEFACRSGGKPENYAGGNKVDQYAWYNGNSGSQLRPVGGKLANGLGIYDMSGNICEWCGDIYAADAYREHTRDNPFMNGGQSPNRVVRGGGWNYSARGVRCSQRYGGFDEVTQYGMIGFRLVMEPHKEP